MRELRLTALSAAMALAACGGDLPPPSPRDPISPRAPEATFDAGINPLGGGLSAAPPSTGEPSMAGHNHAGHGAPPAPSSSGKR